MTDVCTLKKSNLVLPSTYYELDREEMSYVEGGFFIGVEMSYLQILSLYNSCFSALETGYDIIDYGSQISEAVPIVGSAATAFAAKISSCLARVSPFVWIFMGVMAAAAIAIGTYCLINKKGFRIGIDIGWFSLKLVWEFK